MPTALLFCGCIEQTDYRRKRKLLSSQNVTKCAIPLLREKVRRESRARLGLSPRIHFEANIANLEANQSERNSELEVSFCLHSPRIEIENFAFEINTELSTYCISKRHLI